MIDVKKEENEEQFDKQEALKLAPLIGLDTVTQNGNII